MYTIVADVQRTVVEKYVCEVSAGSLDEALDVVYDHFTEFPNSKLELSTRRKVDEQTVSSHPLYLDHEYSAGSANDGPEVA